jgi:radical SAM-linked protein
VDKLRLRFAKTGRAVYISHLDLMRTMQRAFFRAGLPLRYSEGFNPHAQISIALPLSVGAASLCELMDFRLDAEAELSEIPARLNAVMPEGIEAIEAYQAVRKFRELKWLRVRGDFECDNKMKRELERFFSAESIVVPKRTKKGVSDMDIKPAVRSISFTDRGLEAVVSAQEPSLNPELLVQAIEHLAPELAPDFVRFTRLEVYDEKMEIFR